MDNHQAILVCPTVNPAGNPWPNPYRARFQGPTADTRYDNCRGCQERIYLCPTSLQKMAADGFPNPPLYCIMCAALQELGYLIQGVETEHHWLRHRS